MTRCWYVLRVKAHKERTVDESLRVRAVTVYLPTIKVQSAKKRTVQTRPYFPGYLFFQADLEEVGLNAFNWLPGVRGLVTFGNTPATVTDEVIDSLRQQIAQVQRPDGNLAIAPFSKGEAIQIVAGPFAGYSAIFDTYLPGSERVQVLLAFLSQHLQPLQLNTRTIRRT